MSSNTVRDRSGQGLPSKAERRALGKAAARKRAQQRRRREMLNRAGQIAAPIVVVGLIVGAIVLFGGGDDQPTEPTEPAAGPPTTAAPQPTEWTLPAGMDPQLAIKPVVTAGGSEPLTELTVTAIVEGTGPVVEAGQMLTAHYVGVYYATGEEFNSSWDDNFGQPAQFQIGVGRLIKGWDQGLVGLRVGSRVQLDIPVALAYNHQPGQPEGDLRFVVDLLGVSSPSS